jgi:hypothetical protein
VRPHGVQSKLPIQDIKSGESHAPHYSRTPRFLLPKLIARLEFAAVVLGLIAIDHHVAVRPAQEKIGPQGENDGVACTSASMLGPSAEAGKLKFKARPKITG